MEVMKTRQLKWDELANIQFDLLIAAGDDAFSLSREYSTFRISQRLFIKPSQPGFFNLSAGKETSVTDHTLIELSPEKSDLLMQRLGSLLEKCGNDEITLLVDYTGMSKVWYAAVINYLMINEKYCNRIRVYFLHISSARQHAAGRRKSSAARPVLKSAAAAKKVRKHKALLVGLDATPSHALALMKKLRPDKLVILYPEPGTDAAVTGKLLQSNQKIIQKAGAGNILPYPAHDIEKTEEIISSLAFDLRLNHKVFLAPLGARMLSLVCFILYTRFPDVEVWVSNQPEHSLKTQASHDSPSIFEVVFARGDASEWEE